ncbi:uncharacterized protein LOC127855904 [Dreissena polymorpha]|uniref:B box-type domain-containing protein n=1 Tax=Dreissena polymorpha TaxID=45954 RepID=A0A9D4HHV5_DREPO|nr:uncharacterized protein LOC127855904 [Dreissena polymorpha]XP_052247779.1 uncharacterized protein LOC127855904 [Dreissena polymorpha]KAH3718039.1 hypothetical protein DPMN_060837 [Dreissena polymorpha]
MATACTANKGSDHVMEYCCSSCEEDAISQEAAYYCKLCSKFYCCQCVQFHGKLFKKHETYGRDEPDQWPVSKVTQDVLEKCREHQDEHLKFYCEDHRFMCCNSCVVFNHRQCASVISIDQSYEEEISDDLQQLQEKIENIHEQLKQLQNNQESRIITLLESYNESLQKIKNARSTIDAILNILEKDTVQKLEEVLNSLNTPLKKDIENAKCLSTYLRDLGKAIQEMTTKGKKLSFIAYKNCKVNIRKCEKYIHDYSNIKEIKISFKTNTLIENYLSQRPSLGMILHSNQVDDNKEISLLGETIYCARPNNGFPTEIRGVCVHSGFLIITDYYSMNVKLLNSDYYNVLSQCKLDFHPFGICHYNPNNYGYDQHLVAISGKGRIQCVKVDKHNLSIEQNYNFQIAHDCCGIAIHSDDMYITSGSALYHYTRQGTSVKKLYEAYIVQYCAVNRKGDKIFVTKNRSELLTLSKDGTILSIFTDRLLQSPTAVHVTEKGQVLVCGKNNIIQVDSEGKKKITALEIPSVINPLSMCSLGKCVIVGSINILELTIE